MRFSSVTFFVSAKKKASIQSTNAWFTVAAIKAKRSGVQSYVVARVAVKVPLKRLLIVVFKQRRGKQDAQDFPAERFFGGRHCYAASCVCRDNDL